MPSHLCWQRQTLICLYKGKDTSWGQAGTPWSMHQSSWVRSIQFLPEGDLNASPLTTWFGGPFGVTGRRWPTTTTSSPCYCPFTSYWLLACPPGTELPCRAVRWHLGTSILFNLTIPLDPDMLKTTGITRDLRPVIVLLLWMARNVGYNLIECRMPLN